MFFAVKEWFLNIGMEYNVNPLIFGAIYIGAIPFFSISVAWAIRNYKKGKSLVVPIISAGACFVSAYVYLLIVGENVPWWVYVVIVLLLGYGIYSTIKKFRNQVRIHKI